MIRPLPKRTYLRRVGGVFCGNIEFCYSSALKGWISINEIRFQNPFNEDLFAEYDMIFTQSASKVFENEFTHKKELVKVLAKGELTAKLEVRVHAFSAKAKEMIEAVGGTCEKYEAK